EQWEVIAKTIRDADLVPFIDIAYQGFGEGLDTDAAVVRLFAQMGITTFISSSYSKSFSLYGERVGALSILCQSADEAERVLSQVKRVVRTNYSNPPTHGALVVATTLDNPTLFNEWSTELSAMRERIKSMRQQLVEKLHALQNKQRFDHVLTQRGMFSYSGLQAQQVEQLRDQHAVYAVLSGRICLAALNHSNIDYVAKAIAEVLQN
ncbi:MAG TPA: aminotransferase class I/II-fold pyridoxal phosphate-dependent enzyme, partial [Burkholderiaceae bacterium]|nr:aminotransferase class I/II-fold pyridoxal phosphate-dependent enzyme [Burkholderiaceae bacterium]